MILSFSLLDQLKFLSCFQGLVLFCPPMLRWLPLSPLFQTQVLLLDLYTYVCTASSPISN